MEKNTTFEWREGFGGHHGVPATHLASVLREIESAYGVVEPEKLVEYAEQRPDDPVAKLVDVDLPDDEAAHKWRIAQARRVIAALVVVDKSNGRTYPARVSMSFSTPSTPEEEKKARERSYVSIFSIEKSPEYRRKWLRDEIRRIEGLLRRVENEPEIQPIQEAINDVIATLNDADAGVPQAAD